MVAYKWFIKLKSKLMFVKHIVVALKNKILDYGIQVSSILFGVTIKARMFFFVITIKQWILKLNKPSITTY